MSTEIKGVTLQRSHAVARFTNAGGEYLYCCLRALRGRFELPGYVVPPALKAGAVIRAWLPQHVRICVRMSPCPHKSVSTRASYPERSPSNVSRSSSKAAAG